jgi:hypothetical protein
LSSASSSSNSSCPSIHEMEVAREEERDGE